MFDLPDFPIVAAVALTLIVATVAAVQRPTWIVPGLAVIGIFTSRPSLIGERYPYIGVGFIIMAAVLSLAIKRPSAAPRRSWWWVLFILGYLWLVLHGVNVPGSEPNIVSILATTAVPVFAFAVVASNTQLLEMVRNGFVGVVVVTSALTAVALVLGLAFGYGRLQLGVAPVGYAHLGSVVLFPGAFLYGGELGSGIPRFLGLAREPGMGAIYITWAFFALPKPMKRRWLTILVLLVALLATQSTTGIGVFAACYVLHSVFSRNRPHWFVAFLTVAGSAVLLWVAIYNPTFGLLAKTTSGISYSQRVVSTQNGWNAFHTNFWDATTTAPLSNLNLVAAVAAHGGPWLILIGALLVLTVLLSGRRSPLAYGAIFITITMFTSQPIYDQTGVYLLLAMGYVLSRATTKSPPPTNPKVRTAGGVTGLPTAAPSIR